MIIQQKVIAEKAGVSYATVSRAFTGSSKVRPETIQRIRNAMLQLGITNIDDVFLGKSFVSKAVLVVVGDIANEFYANIAKGVFSLLDPLGYSIVFCNSNFDSEFEVSRMRDAANSGYAGIIMITAVETESLVDFLQNSTIPIILVNRYIKALDVDIIRIDNYRGGYMAARYLIECGHTRLVHLAGSRISEASRDRIRGFRDAILECGLQFSERDIFYGDLTLSSGRQFVDWMVQEHGFCYTAAFVGNDYMTAGVVQRLRSLGKTVPKDFSIICFDDSSMVNEESLSITSVSSNPIEMGQAAADVLLKRLDNLLGERRRVIFSPRLTIRSSVLRLSAGQQP